MVQARSTGDNIQVVRNNAQGYESVLALLVVGVAAPAALTVPIMLLTVLIVRPATLGEWAMLSTGLGSVGLHLIGVDHGRWWSLAALHILLAGAWLLAVRPPDRAPHQTSLVPGIRWVIIVIAVALLALAPTPGITGGIVERWIVFEPFVPG